MSHEEAFSSKPTFPTEKELEALKGGNTLEDDDDESSQSSGSSGSPQQNVIIGRQYGGADESDDEGSVDEVATPDSDDNESVASDGPSVEEEEEEEEDDSDLDDSEDDEEGPKTPDGPAPPQQTPSQLPISIGSDTDTDEEDEDEAYLQKLDKDMSRNFLIDFHPEATSHNYDEVRKMAKVARNSEGRVIDALHRTNPFLTKYEYTRVLGQRAKQIDSGAVAFVKTGADILDGYQIAKVELEAKKLPFIIRRPLPGGGFEYWHLQDLELLR
jgi:DNA-directed RNA polymerase I, II, and III subunit RPABC2